MNPEYQTVDVGRIECEIVAGGFKLKALFIGKVIIQGNHNIKVISAEEDMLAYQRGEHNFVKVTDGTLVEHTTITEFNVIKESSELVTFAHIYKGK